VISDMLCQHQALQLQLSGVQQKLFDQQLLGISSTPCSAAAAEAAAASADVHQQDRANYVCRLLANATPEQWRRALHMTAHDCTCEY
jgi:hypothetical protein